MFILFLFEIFKALIIWMGITMPSTQVMRYDLIVECI